MKTKNLTLKIDEGTYRKARLRAARRGTSVSAMVRDYLMKQEEEEMDPESRRIEAFEALFRKAEARADATRKSITPLSRDSVYAERIR